jgi:hypothetical protein
MAYLLRRSPAWRNRCFAMLAISLPFTGLAVVEYAMGKFRWDESLLGRYDVIVDRPLNRDFAEWVRRIRAVDPDYDQRGRMRRDGFELYYPISVPGLHINSLGLRAPEPVRKPPGTRRIAVLGGSTVWSRYVFDHETIPGYLERYFHAAGVTGVEVYNLGLEGMSYPTSVRLLQKLQPLYQFDQVVFYNGVNDLSFKGRDLRESTPVSTKPPGWVSGLNQFYLFRFLQVAYRESARPAVRGDDPDLARAARAITRPYLETYGETEKYCAKQELQCSHFLQPALFHKRYKSETEALIWNNYSRDYPYLQSVYDRSVANIMAELPQHHDLTGILADTREAVFMDWCHATAKANAIIARAIYERISRDRMSDSPL